MITCSLLKIGLDDSICFYSLLKQLPTCRSSFVQLPFSVSYCGFYYRTYSGVCRFLLFFWCFRRCVNHEFFLVITFAIESYFLLQYLLHVYSMNINIVLLWQMDCKLVLYFNEIHNTDKSCINVAIFVKSGNKTKNYSKGNN